MMVSRLCFPLVPLKTILVFSSRVKSAVGYMLDDQGIGVRVPVGAKLFSSLRLSFWASPSLLSNGYCGLFLRE
jgi:hypothetical protein